MYRLLWNPQIFDQISAGRFAQFPQALQGLLICSERIAQEEEFNGGHMTLEDRGIGEPRSIYLTYGL